MPSLFRGYDVLQTEADGKQTFARNLIEGLGYSDHAIRPKTALESLTVADVPGARQYRPAFAMKVAGHIRWVLDARKPDARLDAHVFQARRYCQIINDAYPNRNPVEYFMLTNGTDAFLYRTDKEGPELTLPLAHRPSPYDTEYQVLSAMLRPSAFVGGPEISTVGDVRRNEPAQAGMSFLKPTIPEIEFVFSTCQQFIHQSDKIGQAKGFEEFVKLITLKLLSDKVLRDKYPGLIAEQYFTCPAAEVRFSTDWIRQQEESTHNPVDSILFRGFMDDVQQVRMRVFDQDERINLKPETIRRVVRRLQRYYLFGGDTDLDGRLFDNFLNAAVRGKDLGQYFTPRTLVRMGVGLGDLKPTDKVLDGSCGTGGFLIGALDDMCAKVNQSASSPEQSKEARKNIANSSIYGIDFARNPNLAKIARLNMYLHGDGGSSIFNIDGLDLEVKNESTDSQEEIKEKNDFRSQNLAGCFDVVLTNPPFSKKYERKTKSEARVLGQYTVANGVDNLPAKLMFFEMYHHYLASGGRLVSVIDDGLLSVDSYRSFRKILRKMYIVKAVISLPGDAFQRSEARVKTSFIVLDKREAVDKAAKQTDIFMYACRYVGLDDPKRTRWMPGDDELRAKAKDEVADVIHKFRAFLKGEVDTRYIVPAHRAADRLDVKNCLFARAARASSTSAGIKLEDVAERKDCGPADIVSCDRHRQEESFIGVKGDGTPFRGRSIVPITETQYTKLYRVRTNDIVMSNIAAAYGNVAVVPREMDGMVVSKEYTILRARPGCDARVIWAVLRSPEMRAEMLMRSTGANRTRVSWGKIRDVAFPYPREADVRKFVSYLEAAEAARQRADVMVRKWAKLSRTLGPSSDSAQFILDAFRPPR